MTTVAMLQDSLDAVFAEAKDINPDHKGKIHQLHQHIETCKMLIEQLDTETPYVMPTY